MTVRELIALLAQQDPDALVDIEGCDCIGTPSGVDTYVSVHDKDHLERVLIQRSPE